VRHKDFLFVRCFYIFLGFFKGLKTREKVIEAIVGVPLRKMFLEKSKKCCSEEQK